MDFIFHHAGMTSFLEFCRRIFPWGPNTCFISVGWRRKTWLSTNGMFKRSAKRRQSQGLAAISLATSAVSGWTRLDNKSETHGLRTTDKRT